MTEFIFFFDVYGQKKQLKIHADNFRQARSDFFNRLNDLYRYNLHRVAEVNENDYKIIYDKYN